MKKKLICQVCGYIAAEGKLGDVCPACGVKSSVFKPYEDRVSEKRRQILDMHMHSMLVHFPQAMALLMLFLILIGQVLQDTAQMHAGITVRVLSLLLPISVLGGLFSGFLEGKIRFKKVSTPVLKLKFFLAAAFLVCSTALALFLHLADKPMVWLAVLLSVICAATATLLGLNGGKLSGLTVPG